MFSLHVFSRGLRYSFKPNGSDNFAVKASCLEEVSEGTSLYVRVQIGAEKQKRVTKLSLDSAFTLYDHSVGFVLTTLQH